MKTNVLTKYLDIKMICVNGMIAALYAVITIACGPLSYEFSQFRISELLNLKKEDVNLEEKWFRIVQAKTEAGVRTVPIADKVLPFFQEWYDKNDCEYLLSTPEGEQFKYRNYYDSYWLPFMDQMNMKHTPHETRHTCVSLLASAGVDERVIKKIVGHKGQGVTQTVYTHFEIEELLDAINKI